MKTNKILILVPSPRSPGGVGHYYEKIKPFYTLPTEYFVRGVRNQQSTLSRVFYPVVQLFDYFRFTFRLAFFRYSLVHLNTSFGITGILRDAVFIQLARLFRKKYIVFFRGIDEVVIQKIQKRHWKLFCRTYLQADMIWVLSQNLKIRLHEWGYQGPVEVETTLVDPSLMIHFDLEKCIAKYENPDEFEILFMSRIEKSKGIYEAIDAFRLLQTGFKNIRLRICGSGSETRQVLNYIGDQLNSTIFYEGHVSGNEKIKFLTQAHLFLFPSYFEGMPNALLEALAFGLPAVTSNVGGIPDVFEDEKMGFITSDISPQNLAALMANLIQLPEKCQTISRHNYTYSRERFYAGEVCKRIETYYKTLIYAG